MVPGVRKVKQKVLKYIILHTGSHYKLIRALTWMKFILIELINQTMTCYVVGLKRMKYLRQLEIVVVLKAQDWTVLISISLRTIGMC